MNRVTRGCFAQINVSEFDWFKCFHGVLPFSVIKVVLLIATKRNVRVKLPNSSTNCEREKKQFRSLQLRMVVGTVWLKHSPTCCRSFAQCNFRGMLGRHRRCRWHSNISHLKHVRKLLRVGTWVVILSPKLITYFGAATLQHSLACAETLKTRKSAVMTTIRQTCLRWKGLKPWLDINLVVFKLQTKPRKYKHNASKRKLAVSRYSVLNNFEN